MKLSQGFMRRFNDRLREKSGSSGGDMQIIGVIVVWDDGHERVLPCGEQDAVDVIVRSGVMSIAYNSAPVLRDGATVKATRWLKNETARREAVR